MKPEKEKVPVRRIGFAKGEFTVPPSFFEPLPQDILDAFNCTNCLNWEEESARLLKRRNRSE